MKLKAVKSAGGFKKGQTLVFFAGKHPKTGKIAISEEFSSLPGRIDRNLINTGEGECCFYPLEGSPNIIIAGLGDPEKIDAEKTESAAAAACETARKNKIKEIHLLIQEQSPLDLRPYFKNIAEGIALSNYSFDRYVTAPDKKKSLLESAVFITSRRDASAICSEAGIISGNIILCRNIINESSDRCTPEIFASEAAKLAAIKNISCRIYGKKEIKSMGMGLLLAVNRGSVNEPRLVVLKYTGDPRSKKYTALVGKGLTFDSGGINLKPTGHIETMRMDMAGAATAMYTLKACAELKIKKNIYAVMPLTENMLSGSSYRPGDVYSAYNGKTVEIGNTDAEGRLILADALSFTEKKLKPAMIIDLATLTGACIVALGETVAALITPDDGLADILTASSRATGEKLWRLPLFSDYEGRMKSEIADISNVSSEKNAGTITAGIFLKFFVEKTPWAHLDIAGTAWYSKKRGCVPENATGYGIRLLTDFFKNLK